MADKNKFFELIKPNHHIDFVGKSGWLLALSLLMVIGSFLMLPINHYLKSRGQYLNFAIDFRGGTEMKVQFSRDVEPNQIKDALMSRGISDVEVSPVTEIPHMFLVRFPHVSTITGEQKSKLEAAFIAQLGKDVVRRLSIRQEDGRISLKLNKNISRVEIQKVLSSVGIQVSEDRITTSSLGESSTTYEIVANHIHQEVHTALDMKFGPGSVLGTEGDSVGAKAGKELRDNGIISLLAAIGFIMLYILLRFDFRYSPGTVVALLHDAILVMGAFALTYKEFSLTTIAAILTVIGYSMNDTIVVFDRIRENAARYKDMSFRKVVNLSVNETLSRTILTSATVFFVTLAMNIWGTGVIRDFGFAMNVGVIVGTYSSIFVASPVLIWLHERMSASKK